MSNPTTSGARAAVQSIVTRRESPGTEPRPPIHDEPIVPTQGALAADGAPASCMDAGLRRPGMTAGIVRSAVGLALGLVLMTQSTLAPAQVSLSITLGPPELPVYEQPVLDVEGGIWTPGYWEYGPGGYLWVPGTWVQPPEAGLLWTPGYWGRGDQGYIWNEGYWGTSVGFYGGIDYGFGYSGHGYDGGHWQGQQFYYNTEVSHVDVTNVHNVYRQAANHDAPVSHTSYNGGSGGVAAKPTAAENAAAHAPHRGATDLQAQHVRAAEANPALAASSNRGKPPIAATPHPAQFARPAGTPGGAAVRPVPTHAADLPAITREPVAASGSAERDRANQQQQDQLRDRQEQQRQKLQQQQASEHAQAARQPAGAASNQELEQRHQAQTQELAQRHATEQRSMQESQHRGAEQKPAERPEEPRGR